MDKREFKLIVFYGNKKLGKAEFFCGDDHGYSINQAQRALITLTKCYEELYPKALPLQALPEIALALGIPVKYVPEHKPRREQRHSEEKLDRLIELVRRA